LPDSAPRVFISHAFEDKQRFVIPFATALRAHGIDAWVDAWEIRPGDSLVQKIFDDGIDKAEAAIVVLSPTSITKPWVREELDAAFIRRVEGKLRLIPLVIEDCAIPDPLRHLLYVKIANLHSFGGEVEKLVRDLFDLPSKPPLGPKPSYLNLKAGLGMALPGLLDADANVLQAIGDIYLEGDFGPVDRNELSRRLATLGLSSDLLDESLEILEGDGFVSGTHTIGQKFALLEWTHRGADLVLRSRFKDYPARERMVCIHVANNPQCQNTSVAKSLDLPIVLVDHIIEQLAAQGLVKTTGRLLSGALVVIEISARLRRMLA